MVVEGSLQAFFGAVDFSTFAPVRCDGHIKVTGLKWFWLAALPFQQSENPRRRGDLKRKTAYFTSQRRICNGVWSWSLIEGYYRIVSRGFCMDDCFLVIQDAGEFRKSVFKTFEHCVFYLQLIWELQDILLKVQNYVACLKKHVTVVVEWKKPKQSGQSRGYRKQITDVTTRSSKKKDTNRHMSSPLLPGFHVIFWNNGVALLKEPVVNNAFLPPWWQRQKDILSINAAAMSFVLLHCCWCLVQKVLKCFVRSRKFRRKVEQNSPFTAIVRFNKHYHWFLLQDNTAVYNTCKTRLLPDSLF